MPGKGLLFNRSSTYRAFRRDFFSTYHVKTIINLSTYRHIIFEKSSGPAAAIYFTLHTPDENVPVLYCSPKPRHSLEDRLQITIESQNIVLLPRNEACKSDVIWKVAMWGTPRDYELVKKLMSQSYKTLENICAERQWTHGEGFIRGDESKEASWLYRKPLVESEKFTRFVTNEKELKPFNLLKLERPRSKNRAIFCKPHIIIEQSPKSNEKKFRAALLLQDAVFNQSFVGIHAPSEDTSLLAICCLMLNSSIPLYFALMSSSRWLVERDKLTKGEMVDSPLPPDIFNRAISHDYLKKLSSDSNWEEKLESNINILYDLTEDEYILIDDALNYTLSYFRSKENSEAAEPTFNNEDGERFLEQYIRIAHKTLQNSFKKTFQPIIFQGDSSLRVVALTLVEDSASSQPEVVIETSQAALNVALEYVEQYLTEQRSANVFIRRHVRAYIGRTIYLVKPDQRRYWTRADALRDADEIYADIMQSWRQ